MRRNFIVFILLAFLVQFAHAQRVGNFPSSRSGIGDITSPNFIALRSMGGVSSSFYSTSDINLVNPASLGYLQTAVYEVGMFAKNSTVEDDVVSSNFWTGNLDYIAIGFPLSNPINDLYEGKKRDWRFGMAFNLRRNSSIAYDVSTVDSSDVTNVINRFYSGQGGTYKFEWGNSASYKNFAFGVNVGYLFGNAEYSRDVFFSSLDLPYNNRYSSEIHPKGFVWSLGALYTHTLNKKEMEAKKNVLPKTLTLGLRGNSGNRFAIESRVSNFAVQQLASNITLVDTISFREAESDRGSLPAEFGLGLNYVNKEKFSFAVDYRFAAWSEYFNEASNEEKGSLTNTSSFSVGGFYCPNYKSFDSYWKRVKYRYGAYYEADPRSVNENEISRYGVTLGMGLPFVFQRKLSKAELGLELGRNGVNSGIEETFVKINFGFTFTDEQWFIKRKYN